MNRWLALCLLAMAAWGQQGTAAESLLARAQAALGGAEKIAAVRDLTVTGTLKSTSEGIAAPVTIFWLPGVFRQEGSLPPPIGKVTIFADRTSGWMASGQRSEVLQPPAVQQFLGANFRQLPSLLMVEGRSGVTVNALADSTIEITGAGQHVWVKFDGTSGLPSSMWYEDGGQRTVESYADWRDVNGIKMPFAITLDRDTLTVAEYKFNTGLKAEDLGKRP